MKLEIGRGNSTFYKKLERVHMSRFKALRVVDPRRLARTVDLLTNIQTFLNHREHRMNI